MTPDAIIPVRRLIDERVPIRVLMEQRLVTMARDWIPREQTPDWDALRALDFEGEFLRMSEWIHGILTRDPFPADVNGLFFGFLFPPSRDLKSAVAIFLSGSRFYGNDGDWARKGEVPDDGFIDHSPLLLMAYRLIVSADVFGNARDLAIGFCHLFVSLAVAEWYCTPMRHTLRGRAPSRGLFVGLDPWMGFNIGVLEADRPGGGGSVVVSWHGAVKGGARQAEWLTSIRQIANWHELRWNEVSIWDERRLGALAKLRGSPDVPARPVIRWFDEELHGRILVSPDVMGDEAVFKKEAARHGITLEEIEIRGQTHVLLPLKRLEVRGVDFRAFDLRGLYPGEDRMSFFLLQSDEAPFLNDRIAAIDERAFNLKAYTRPVAHADWYVQSPFVHLRDYGEEWTAEFLAWLRYFFAPDFHYSHRGEPSFHYTRFLTQHEFLDERFGRETAMELGLRRLHLHFLVEAKRAAEIFET
jgi:hypothetical protein